MQSEFVRIRPESLLLRVSLLKGGKVLRRKAAVVIGNDI